MTEQRPEKSPEHRPENNQQPEQTEHRPENYPDPGLAEMYKDSQYVLEDDDSLRLDPDPAAPAPPIPDPGPSITFDQADPNPQWDNPDPSGPIQGDDPFEFTPLPDLNVPDLVEEPAPAPPVPDPGSMPTLEAEDLPTDDLNSSSGNWNGNGISGAYGDGPDLDGNGVPDEIGINPDILHNEGNKNGMPDEYGDGPDLDRNGVPDEIGINPDGLQPGYPGGEWPDSNRNGIPGGYGGEPDLDGNGVPDEIGINPDNLQPSYPGGLSDGNGNGIAGEYGDGPDLDGNGVPDEIGINPDTLRGQSGIKAISNEDVNDGGDLEPLGGFYTAADDAAHDRYSGPLDGFPERVADGYTAGDYDEAIDKAAQDDWEGALKDATREYLGERYYDFLTFDGQNERELSDLYNEAFEDATGIDGQSLDRWGNTFENMRDDKSGDESSLDELGDGIVKEGEEAIPDRWERIGEDYSGGNYPDALSGAISDRFGEGYGKALDHLDYGESYHDEAFREATREAFGEDYGDAVSDVVTKGADLSGLSDAAAKAAGDHVSNTLGVSGFDEAISDVFSGDIEEDFGEDVGQVAGSALGGALGGPLGAIAGESLSRWIGENVDWSDVEDLGKDIGGAAEDVGEAIGGAAEDVGEAIGDAAEDVGDWFGF